MPRATKNSRIASDATGALASGNGSAVKRKDDPWVDWSCPFCNADVSDPASIKETSCGCGETVYLGKVIESLRGYCRRAFKTNGERRREMRKERIMHEGYMTMMNAAFPNRIEDMKRRQNE